MRIISTGLVAIAGGIAVAGGMMETTNVPFSFKSTVMNSGMWIVWICLSVLLIDTVKEWLGK